MDAITSASYTYGTLQRKLLFQLQLRFGSILLGIIRQTLPRTGVKHSPQRRPRFRRRVKLDYTKKSGETDNEQNRQQGGTLQTTLLDLTRCYHIVQGV